MARPLNLNLKPGAESWALAAAASLFYLSAHSTFYNFDGVACAIAVDLGDFKHLVHGNHLSYGLCGWLFHRFWQALGYEGPSLLPLQVLDSLLGGAGVGVFHRCLAKLKTPRAVALPAGAGLAVSYAYWFWSLEVQVYLLGTLFLLLTLSECLDENPRPGRAGLLHGLAVLGHAGHVMFLPAALYLFQGRKKDIPRYLAALAAAVVAAYGLVALFIVRPQTYHEWRVWLLGSAALTLDKSFQWHGGYSWDGLREWALMTFRVFSGPAQSVGPAGIFGWLLAGAALAAAAWGLKGQSRAARAALLWIAGYALLFISWEPYTIVYRISDLPALWLLIALAFRGTPARIGAGLLCGWALTAGVFNWTYSIQPRTDPLKNAAYQEALWIGSVTPENSWVAARSIDEVYIPYFAHRRPLNLRYFEVDPRLLIKRLRDMELGGEPVYVAEKTLSPGPWNPFFRDYGLEEAARRADGVLYRIKRKGSPKEANKKS